MPIQLRNKGRAPITVELASLGKQAQIDVRIGRDPKTGAVGPMELERAYPKSVFIPGRGLSEELPDAVKGDPALREWPDLAVEPAIEITPGGAGEQALSAPKEL